MWWACGAGGDHGTPHEPMYRRKPTPEHALLKARGHCETVHVAPVGAFPDILQRARVHAPAYRSVVGDLVHEQ